MRHQAEAIPGILPGTVFPAAASYRRFRQGRKNYTKTQPIQFKELAKSILEKERRIVEIVAGIHKLLKS